MAVRTCPSADPRARPETYCRACPRRRGSGLLELLLAILLGSAALTALAGIVAPAGRYLQRAGLRAESSDTIQLATEALLFDIRRAGFDPRGVGVARLPDASSEMLLVEADLDGDGVIDDRSAERVRYRCDTSRGRLSRIVGRQSMPLATGLTSCAFSYLDARALPVTGSPAGLDAADRARVRAVTMTIAGTHTGGTASTTRQLTVAFGGRE